MEWYIKVLKNFANFDGRARRQEYWMFFLFNMIFAVVAMILDSVLGLTIGDLPYGAFYIIYVLAMFIPGLAVTIRRLHDLGKSGAWFFIAFVPLIGGIWLLVLMATEGEKVQNEYGPDPKGAGGEASTDNSDLLDSSL